MDQGRHICSCPRDSRKFHYFGMENYGNNPLLKTKQNRRGKHGWLAWSSASKHYHDRIWTTNCEKAHRSGFWGPAKRRQHFHATDINIVAHSMLDNVGSSLKMVKFFSQHLATFLNVAWSCTRLATFAQHCCAGARALVRNCAIQHNATYCNRVAKRVQHVVYNNVALCSVQMLRAFGQLLHNISQHDPTMLGYVAFKCCVRLVGP